MPSETDEMALNSNGAESLAGLPETRVFYLELPENPSADRLARQIALAGEAGFNALAIPFFSNGFSIHHSDVCKGIGLPLCRPDLKRDEELLDVLFETADAHSLKVYALASPLSAGDEAYHWDARYPFFRRGHRLAARNKLQELHPLGNTSHERFLCLYNPETRHFAADLMVEIAETYPVSALVLDIANYPFSADVPENNACFCRFCKKEVAEEIQIDLNTLPLDPSDTAFRIWNRWKNARCYDLVRNASSRVHKVRRDCPFFVLVSGPLESSDEQTAGENTDPSSWLSDGLSSALLISYESSSPEEFISHMNHDSGHIEHDNLMAPFLKTETIAQLAGQMNAVRTLPLGAAFVRLNDELSEESAAEIRTLCFPVPAADIFINRREALWQILWYLLGSSDAHPALDSFLKDVLIHLENTETLTLEKVEELVEDFHTLELQFLSGDMDSALLPLEALRHLSLIKKILKSHLLHTI